MVTAAGGVGAVIATAGLAGWLSQPAHAKPGSTAKSSSTGSSTSSSSGSSSSGSGSSSSQSDGTDGGLQLPDASPTTAAGGSSDQPQVSSGGS
jgi:hypothetical protein